MFKLRFLKFVAGAFFGFSLLANFFFAVGVSTAFARGGLKGVAGWINHITYEGRLQSTEVSPGVFRIATPTVKHVYLGFVFDWLFMIGLLCLSFYLLKFCARRIHAKEGRA